MKLRCGSCGTHFDVGPDDKPRCPNCLRTLGLAPDAPANAPARRRPRLGVKEVVGVVVVALALVGVVAGVWLAQRSSSPGDESAASLTPLAELPPAEAARRRGAAKRLVGEGRALLRQGKLREANQKAEEALRQAPSLAEVRQLRGEIYRASGALREALGEFTAALSIEETPDRHVMTGQALALLNELERAERPLPRAVTQAPGESGPPTALALFYWSTDATEKLDELRQSLQGGPDGGGPSPLLAELEATLREAQELEERRRAQLAERLAAARAAEAAAAHPDGGAPTASPTPAPAPASAPTGGPGSAAAPSPPTGGGPLAPAVAP